MLVTQAYRFELDPNDKCRSGLASHAGAARFAYNWGLGLVGNHLSARRALVVLAVRQGASRGEAEEWADGVLGPLPWTLPALRRAWNQAKAGLGFINAVGPTTDGAQLTDLNSLGLASLPALCGLSLTPNTTPSTTSVQSPTTSALPVSTSAEVSTRLP